MGNSESQKTNRIPSWQLKNSADPSPSEDHASEPRKGKEITPEQRQNLLKDAAKFLNEKDIRNAPTERKISFLEAKGLTEDEVQSSLQQQVLERDTAEIETCEGHEIKEQESGLQSLEPKPRTEDDNDISDSGDDCAKSTTLSVKQDERSLMDGPSKEVPPIITYPEFLLHSQKPPPLITSHRLLNTFYIASGAAATLYGTSKYIVEPMIESLTSARQSLAETALSNIEMLNSRLANAVSKLPENTIGIYEDDGSEVESMDSDPSRLFSRSAGTQTSLNHTPSSSSPSTEEPKAVDLSRDHAHTLSAIHEKLSDLHPDDETPLLEFRIGELRKFLDDLPDTNASSQNRKSKLWEQSKLDEYGKLKSEIRGLKGVLLSARNFPSSVAVR